MAPKTTAPAVAARVVKAKAWAERHAARAAGRAKAKAQAKALALSAVAEVVAEGQLVAASSSLQIGVFAGVAPLEPIRLRSGMEGRVHEAGLCAGHGFHHLAGSSAECARSAPALRGHLQRIARRRRGARGGRRR